MKNIDSFDERTMESPKYHAAFSKNDNLSFTHIYKFVPNFFITYFLIILLEWEYILLSLWNWKRSSLRKHRTSLYQLKYILHTIIIPFSLIVRSIVNLVFSISTVYQCKSWPQRHVHYTLYSINSLLRLY